MSIINSNQSYEAEKETIKKWQPPPPHKIAFMRRVFEIEKWVERNGLVEKEEVIAYVIARWDVQREQARKYVDEVINQMSSKGKVYTNYR